MGQMIVPELKFRGIWLRNNGFEAGHYVEVTYGKEYIVVYPYKNYIDQVENISGVDQLEYNNKLHI